MNIKELQDSIGKREIKFRAWDKKRKEWVNWHYHCIDENGTVSFYKSNILEADENFPILMQYTGLKDKNDKEIYEGDIVRYYIMQNGTEMNGVGFIVYDEGFSQFVCRAKIKGLNDLQDYPLRVEMRFTEFKVIGNIFENSNLIK